MNALSLVPLQPADMVVLLRDLRAESGLTQHEVAQRSGVGEKTLASFEGGGRIESMKVDQLRLLCQVYRISMSQFFAMLEGRKAVESIPFLGEYEAYRRAFVQLVTRGYGDGLARSEMLELLAESTQVPRVSSRKRGAA